MICCVEHATVWIHICITVPALLLYRRLFANRLLHSSSNVKAKPARLDPILYLQLQCSTKTYAHMIDISRISLTCLPNLPQTPKSQFSHSDAPAPSQIVCFCGQIHLKYAFLAFLPRGRDCLVMSRFLGELTLSLISPGVYSQSNTFWGFCVCSARDGLANQRDAEDVYLDNCTVSSSPQ